MGKIDHIRIPTELFKLNVRGEYRLSILALVYNFNDQGLQLSNGTLAEAFNVDKRTVERAISALRKNGYIRDKGTGRNDRTLVLTTDTMSALDTDIRGGKVPTSRGASADKTADHKEKRKENNINTNTNFTFVLRHEKLWQLPQEQFDGYERTYPDIEIEAELRKAAQWLVDNPAKRKTADGMRKFLNGWLSRAKPAYQQTKGKLQMLTPEAETKFLENNSRDVTEAEAEELLRKAGAA